VDPEVSHEVFGGRIFSVHRERWPGSEDEYDVVRHPGAAAVLPITPNGDVLFVRQFRPAIRQVLTEIPAGLLDVGGEDAVTCASRELFEETGYRHGSIEFLGGCFTSAGFTDEYVHLFVANVHEGAETGPGEGIELLRTPFREVVIAARGGRIRDVKTALALLLTDARDGVRPVG
jgi:ADP-ribose pyrophosphatase